ncbi:hypothetical protein SynA15127_02379 [Synechococcus sp. A15-127]|uniref:sporadic carbohydrate cluster 2OG-Fe(II) oxygenase n=1 Tax=Synechococcus sp. A15-127 TaxID=1050624 RepID=UPI001644A574|nr:sporadic carbohydrate cluster 2OG-Fe(II) oxygenase [Synechococcus sp. A15-127]QNI95443.1 hypothetical protein SynA15127_02379 [Synechococcus sp. A15-127]
MNSGSSWDFRDKQELIASQEYNKEGYIIEKADFQHLELIKNAVQKAYCDFCNINEKEVQDLENAHLSISHDKSNDLRLHIMQAIYQNTGFHKNYYYAAKNIIHSLCGNELAMQKRPGLSVNLPQNPSDVLPIHADTWNGVSPFELNIWIPLVDCANSMCLYILKRNSYKRRLNESKELLRLTSDELFNELRDDLTWIPIEYGQILAFDQSLPHGYSLNEERNTHWSINCRFKGLHTPYWDKKLGEYFMPITVKNCTRLGMDYSHPESWI